MESLGNRVPITIFALGLSCVALLPHAAAGADKKPDGKGARIRQALPILGAQTNSISGITYHGGPLMVGVTNVYYIFYGNWGGNTGTTILPDLASKLGGTPYFNTNNSYSDSTGRYVANAVNYVGSMMDPYSRGSNLADTDVQAIVTAAINSGKLGGADPNGVYFVLTSADVKETSGFCTQYCGWHDFLSIGGAAIKYAFIGNGDQCPSACQFQSISPNGNAGADGMASIIVHELSEAVTDPQLNGWYDSAGQENGDKCSFNFGATSLAPNGSKYNLTFGARNFLIQTNWVNDGAGYCATSWTRSKPVAPTADSVTPNTGSGMSQLFTFQASSASGSASVNNIYALFSPTLSGTNACWVVYIKQSNGLYLADDSGYSILGPIAPGSSGTLQNSQCTLSGQKSSVSGAGNTVSLALDLSFVGSLSGLQSAYLFASDVNGLDTGWQKRGEWTVPHVNSPPVSSAVAPSSGSGTSQSFTFQFSSVSGYKYLNDVHALFNANLNGTAGCWVLYDKAAGAFFLANDPGYGTVGPLAPGAPGTLQNSQCTLAGAGSSVSGAGNVLTMTLNLSFSPSFSGSQQVFMYASDAGGANSGWQNRGTWTVPGSNPPPTADSVIPNSGSGANQTFAFQYSSGSGAGHLSALYLLFSPALSGSGACWVYYDKAANGLFLVNDAGYGTTGPLAPGAAGTLANSQCTVNGPASSVSSSGNSVTITVNLAFNHSFAGSQSIFMYAADTGGLSTGWQTRGTWIVP